VTIATELDRPSTLDSADELDDLVATHDRVLVEFHTQGCSMCAAMQPVLGGVARSSAVAVATMNPRDDPVLLDEYDVRSVPKLLYFEDGELVDTREEGFVPTADVLDFVGED
jgi:thioredoxin-like negative regulator of GroEL